MSRTDIGFLNTLAPTELVRFDVTPAGGSVVVLDQTSYAIFVNVPASHVFVGNPTKELLDRIAELKAAYVRPWLPHSAAPSDNAFQNARDFITTLPLSRITKPAIHVASDGEVNFQWSGPDFRIDLGFYGDGKFSYYGQKKGCEPLLGEEIPVKAGAPKTLLDLAST